MPGIPFIILLLLLIPTTPAAAASLEAPALSPPLSAAKFFDPDRLVTTGGVKYSASGELSLEPQWGVGYRASARDIFGGITESHRLHAQAGWRLSLADTLYLSAAAKLPLLSIDSAGRYTGQDIGTRRGYDFARPFKSTPTWTGEVGVHFTSWTDLTLYYDQSPVTSWFQGKPQQEERIGTRIIFKFE